MTRKQLYAASRVSDNTPIFATFDVETIGLGGECVLSQAYIMGKAYYFKENPVDNLIDLIIQYPEPFVHYAHHAQYDWRYILPRLIERGFDVDLSLRTDTDIYQIAITTEQGKVIMRDSLALINSSLDKLTESLCPEMRKGFIDFENVTFDIENTEHIEYAVRDVISLYMALVRFNSLLIEHFGISVGHTTAGTALKAWMNTLDNEVFNPSQWNEREQFIREGYYGGLVFLTRNDLIENGGEPVADTFDINSSYPAVMCEFGVPYGTPFKSLNYKSGFPGVYRVVVKTPDDLQIPILPSRDDKGSMRWVRGTFETVVTNYELIYALEQGYEIFEVKEGYYFPETVYPFADVIGKCKYIRTKYKGQALEFVAKLIQNSLYGKFGSRRERLKVIRANSDDDLTGANPLDETGYFWVKKEFNDEMLCLPEWAVFITAHARLRLIKTAYDVGVEHVVYGDTDSLTLLRSADYSKIDQGAEYGQFKLEKTWASFRAIAPKVYSGELIGGGYKGAIKGVSKKYLKKNPEKWAELQMLGQIEGSSLSLPSLQVALKKGVKAATELKRKSSALVNSVNWELQGERVYPKIKK